MAKQGVNKKYSVGASGILDIEKDDIYVEVEDVGTFSLKHLLNDFDGRSIKLSCTYDEEYDTPVDVETGEVL